MRGLGGCLAPRSQELLHSQSDVGGDLTQQGWRDVPSLVNWDGRATPIWMLELLVRTSLTGLLESEPLKQGDDFAGLEDRRLHGSGDGNGLYADELRIELGFAVLEQQGDDLTQIGLQLVQGLRLTVCTREAGDIADVKLRVGIPLDDGRVCGHGINDTS